MSKYGDDYKCTCEMELVSCKNEYHAEQCELWSEPTFVDGSDEWDGDLGCLLVAQNPWHHPEDFVWNGDTPVVRKSTMDMAQAISDWETAHDSLGSGIEIIGVLEQEALDAITADPGAMDEYHMVCLPDGSFADFESRVTYRRQNSNDDTVYWDEEFWDAPKSVSLEQYEWDTSTTSYVETPVTCTCPTAKSYFCHACGVQRKNPTDTWMPWDRNAKATTNNATSNNWETYKHCSHVFETFDLPGEQHTNIKISGKRWHTATTTPDFGLYLYGGWDPDCVATFLPWADYGLPKVEYNDAAEAIKHAWDLSCSGKVVEVGCMGGHGRTGTVLACMAILSDPEMSPRSAVAWVRKVHCNEAIETNQQEWFIAWFKSWLTGSKCPEQPTAYVSKHSANWNAATTAATAVKEGGATLPLASRSGGQVTSVKWCQHCMRTVHVQHNNGCPFDLIEEPVQDAATANSRRKNAKRAIRRAAAKKRIQARKAKANAEMGTTDYV